MDDTGDGFRSNGTRDETRSTNTAFAQPRRQLYQYDLTPEQYAALTRLTAALCQVFPKLKCDYPRDAEGRLVPGKLPEEQLQCYQGVLGHFHIQTDKVDPGPALQWDKLIDDARSLLQREPPVLGEKPASRMMRPGR